MNQSGMLPLIYAHLFSLSQMREVFARQMQQGKAPEPESPQPAPRDAEPVYSAAVANWRPSSASPSSTASASIKRRDPVEARAGLAQRVVEIAAAVDFELQRVDAARRARVALDHMPAGEGIVEPGLEPAARAMSTRRALTHASAVRPRRSPKTIGGDARRRAAASNGSRAAARSRSGRAAATSCSSIAAMIGPVRLVEPLVELAGVIGRRHR